jgi:hypothetical protein
MRLWPFGSRRAARALSRAANPHYDWPLNEVLLHWSKHDTCTFRDAMAGILVLGAIGSGKSTGSGQCIALSMLAAGFGLLVLCAKPDEADVWERYCQVTGRSADLIRFSANGQWRFDPLNYELQRPGAGAGHCENIVGLLISLLEIADRNSGSGGGGRDEEGFWRRALRQLLRNIVDLIVMARGRVTVPDLYNLVMSAPTSLEQVRSAEWRERSFCFKCLEEAEIAVKTPRQKHDFKLVADYLLCDFPNLSEKPRSIIVSSFTSMIDVINRGLLRELFCTETNVTPAAIEEGKVLVIDIPVREYGDIGLFAAILWKYAFQKSIERRDIIASPRPVTLWADEAQNFVTSYDMQFQATCRAAKVSTVLLSQNLSNFYAALGGEKGKAEADSLLANLNTKIFHANGDHVTNEWASSTLGKSRQFLMNGNSQQGEQSAYELLTGTGKSTSSAGFSESIQAEVEPSEFTRLRTGGPENKWLVDAILFANGVRFKATGKPYLYTTFQQR